MRSSQLPRAAQVQIAHVTLASWMPPESLQIRVYGEAVFHAAGFCLLWRVRLCLARDHGLVDSIGANTKERNRVSNTRGDAVD